MPRRQTAEDPRVAYMRDLGHRLHQLRIKRDLTQERLAVAAGISAFTYRKLEKGESNPNTPANPRLGTLLALAEVLQIDVRELLPDAKPSGFSVGAQVLAPPVRPLI